MEGMRFVGKCDDAYSSIEILRENFDGENRFLCVVGDDGRITLETIEDLNYYFDNGYYDIDESFVPAREELRFHTRWNSSIRVLKENYDGKHSLLCQQKTEDRSYVLYMTMEDFSSHIDDWDFHINKRWLRDRKLKSLGV